MIASICFMPFSHFQRLNSAIIYDRDFNYTYFGFKTLERSYLLKINGKGWQLLCSLAVQHYFTYLFILSSHLTVAERPQHMLMRVAVGIHMDDIDAAIEVNPTNYVLHAQ